MRHYKQRFKPKKRFDSSWSYIRLWEQKMMLNRRKQFRSPNLLSKQFHSYTEKSRIRDHLAGKIDYILCLITSEMIIKQTVDPNMKPKPKLVQTDQSYLQTHDDKTTEVWYK